MRSYDLRISADIQLFNSRTDLQEGEPIVTAIHGIKPAGDDSIGMLYEYSSGRDAVEAHLANVPTVDTDEVQWAEHGDNTLVYSAREPVGPAAELLETLFSSPVVVEYPITVTPADDLLVTLAGDGEHLQALVRADTSHLDITVERSGPYRPGVSDAFSELTLRQQEVLVVAAEQGYYRHPRRATYAEIAEELDVAYSTVGEHLRKAEARLLSRLIPADLPAE